MRQTSGGINQPNQALFPSSAVGLISLCDTVLLLLPGGLGSDREV